MFLSKILPSTGMYCVALLKEKGWFQHFFHKTLTTAAVQCESLDKGGHTVYIAQASFNEEKILAAQAHNSSLPYGSDKSLKKKERSQENAELMKSFFLDIDCGEKWPLKDQLEAINELNTFIAETKLPAPAVINSGTGLYAYWILTDAIPADKWRTIAFTLKRVVATYSPKLGGDSSRTSDSASVLRPPGAHNRKNGNSVEVAVLRDAEMVDFVPFVDALQKAARKKQITTKELQAPKQLPDINAEFYTDQSTPKDASRIAAGCAQLELMRATKGDVTEPLWYACLGVLSFCERGEELAQEWSSGHEQYDPKQTSSKMQQWKDSGMGPTTCVKFGEVNPQGCIGCPSNGKIKSPIILGNPAPVAIPLEEGEEDIVPEGYRVSKDGLYCEEDGRWTKFYDMDLRPSRLAWDESLGYEVMTIKHHLPHEGDMECTVRSSLVTDPKALLTILADNHIKVVGVKEKKFMVAYLESYQQKLQRQRRMSMLLCQMGWKTARNGSEMFVLGEKVFHADGSTEDASLAKNVPTAAAGFRSHGNLADWVKATEVFEKPGMEPFAFALLAGGFGAPLMKFTGFDGALLSLVGTSGVGKTLMLRFLTSVWGYHKDLIMLRDDTNNALMSRLGVYGNLPLAIDEMTNVENMEFSTMVYRITQGRDKSRLSRDAVESKILNKWNTIAVASSNSSLVDKLSDLKLDSSAEMNRVFEYTVYENDVLKGKTATDLYWTLDNNYGLAGERYAQWLVQNTDDIKEKLEKLRAYIEDKAQIRSEERFWGAIVTVATYGGFVAKSLGLINFEVTRILDWAAKTIANMRESKDQLSGDSVSILAQFIDAHTNGRMVVTGNAQRREGCTILLAPKGALCMRQEADTKRLYISRAVFKAYLGKHFGSYATVKDDLQKLGVLKNPNRRKTLGAGTFYGGAQQPCWEIDLSHFSMYQVAPHILEVGEALQKAPLEDAAFSVPVWKGGK